jgi:hypothetical protein
MKYGLRGAALALPAVLAILNSACSSPPPSNSGDGGTTTETGNTGTTFTEVYTTIIAINCTNAMCHFSNAGPAEGSLDMSSQATAYAQLVNVPAVTAPIDSVPCTGDRVVPGSPSTSLMYLKVTEFSPPCGAQMPLAKPVLPAEDIALIQSWIMEGAKP